MRLKREANKTGENNQGGADNQKMQDVKASRETRNNKLQTETSTQKLNITNKKLNIL